MNIVLIHGEDTVNSRKRFAEIVSNFKSKGWETISITSPKEASTSSFFSDKTLFTLEKINSLPPKDIKWLLESAESLEGNVLLYQEGVISAGITKIIPKGFKVERFDLPKIIFSFLESVFPGNSKKSLQLLRRLSEKTPIEMVFSLLARQMRDLYWYKKDSQTLSYPAWRMGKIKFQADKFPDATLEKFISALAEIDVKVKTSPADLVRSLDLVIITNLK